MRPIITLVAVTLMFCISAVQAQFDSLFRIWEDVNLPDTLRAAALLEATNQTYLYTQPDSAFYYAQVMYDFALDKDLKREMANALNTQAGSFYVKSDFVHALEYYHKALMIYEEMGNLSGMGRTYNNIGVMHSILGQYTDAMDFHQRSLDMKERTDDRNGMAGSMNNIGLIYMNQGNYPRALDYFQGSLKIMEEFSNTRGIAQTLNNIGLIYLRGEEYPKALEYFQKSLKLCNEISDHKAVAGILSNIGLIYKKQKMNVLALDYYRKSLEMKEKISDRNGIADVYCNIGEIYMGQQDYSTAMEFMQKGLDIYEDISDRQGLASAMINMGNLHYARGDFNRAIQWCKKGQDQARELDLLQEQKDACQCLYGVYKEIGNPALALQYYEEIAALGKSLQAEETSIKLQQMEFSRQLQADSLVREKEKMVVEMAHAEEVRQGDRLRNILILSAVFFLIGATLLYSRMTYIRKSKQALENEKSRSDNLLLNILPEEIAEELKEKGRAEAKRFEKVSILFTDFRHFTEIAEMLSAEELVGRINACFEKFDAICTKYGIEKIKTMGDSYMAAGGLPVPSDDSVKKTVLAGLEMAECMVKHKAEGGSGTGKCFEMRVGIHTGHVVAGIVGTTKFQYDIWGDTVNTASRMEGAGEVGKVNISRATREHIKDDPDFRFEARGKIRTKGKGEIEMWFVERVS